MANITNVADTNLWYMFIRIIFSKKDCQVTQLIKFGVVFHLDFLPGKKTTINKPIKPTNMRGFSFSWKRLLGITQIKKQIATGTGIPTNHFGLERKIGRYSALNLSLVHCSEHS